MTLHISVVIASLNASQNIEDCIASLDTKNNKNVEVIVVENSTDQSAKIITKFPQVTLIKSNKCFIPQLWEIGIRKSRGDIVALTTAHFIVKEDWLEKIRCAHKSDCAGIAGAIENDKSAKISHWGIYFCRYSKYMLPFRSHLLEDLPADNASYKRKYLELCKELREDGFWEPRIHHKLLQNGLKLSIDPSIVVYYKQPFTFFEFIKQRFFHGYQFGSTRSLAIKRRILYIILSPLIPIVLMKRIMLRVLKKKRLVKKLLLSFPVLIIFLAAWSIGELIGYLFPKK